MNAPRLFPSQIVSPGTVDWMQHRLTEARGILADIPQHRDTLIILAARVVLSQSHDGCECADAAELLRLLDRRPLPTNAPAACPKGGVA